ncbi:MAG: hypothetical protein ACRDNW_18005 [Trebonia sp.]
MSGMATMPEMPEMPEIVDSQGVRDARSIAAWAAAAFACSVVLGLIGGLIWGEFAPRAMLQEIGTGTAQIVNAETRAFFGADVWFCAIATVAGLLTGILGYRFAVARRQGGARAAMAAALILGAVAGGFAMLWLGEQIGLSGYTHQLATSANGTLFAASLALGAKSGLAFWPLFTSVVLLIAEWGTRNATGKHER